MQINGVAHTFITAGNFATARGPVGLKNLCAIDEAK
jgi:hypothetical protein